MRRDRLIATRKALGKSQAQVAEEVGVDRTSVGFWERGEATPHPGQRRHYAESLEITLTELDVMLSNMPPPSDRTPVWLSQYLGMEQSASQILDHVPNVVQGLLQTPEYARAIGFSVGDGMSEDYARRNSEQRAWRQAKVIAGGVRLHVVQSEIALRLRMGSPAVMAEQMDYLVEMGQRDYITIQVVPFDRGQYEALRMGKISVLTHPWVNGVSVYYQPYGGIALVENSEEAANFLAAIERATTIALPPDDSLAFIAQVADQWRTTDE